MDIFPPLPPDNVAFPLGKVEGCCTSSDKISSGSKFAGVDGFVGKIGRRDGGNLKTGRFAWDCDTVNRSGVSGLCAIVDVGEYIILWTVSRVFYSRLSFFRWKDTIFQNTIYTSPFYYYIIFVHRICVRYKRCVSRKIFNVITNP